MPPLAAWLRPVALRHAPVPAPQNFAGPAPAARPLTCIAWLNYTACRGSERGAKKFISFLAFNYKLKFKSIEGTATYNFQGMMPLYFKDVKPY